MAMSQKKAMTGAASMDLGLGDQLKNQVNDELEQRKKKLLAQSKMGAGALGPATMSLFGQNGTSGGFNA